MESAEAVEAFHRRDQVVQEAIKECAHHTALHPEGHRLGLPIEVQLQKLCEEVTEQARRQH